MSFKFREDDIVTINSTKPLTFQIIDWRSYDYKIPFDNESKKHGGEAKYRKEFRVQLFGVTPKGRSVSATLTGFNPYFYVKIPENWTNVQVQQVINSLNQLVPTWERDSLLSYQIIYKKKFRGFTNNTYYPFVELKFKSRSGFNQYKKVLENPINIPNGKKVRLALYESSLEPIMRVMHILNIDPAGWVTINKYSICDDPLSTSQIDIITKYTQVKKCDRSDIAPLIVASFDIESDSSHGDFPQAKKGYTKLSTDIINHYFKTKSRISKLQKSNSNPVLLKQLEDMMSDKFTYFQNLIEAAFVLDSALRTEDINFIYTRNLEKPTKKEIIGLIKDVIKICDRSIVKMKGTRELKDVVQKVLRKWTKEKDENHKYSVYDLEDLVIRSAKKYNVEHSMLHCKIFTKDILSSLLTSLFDKTFPPVEGDKVIQIATVVFVYGQVDISYRHIVTLNSCDPIDGAEVVACETEEEVLLEWTKFIQRLDPDIITGYNIFGFDYSYLFYRAQELDCVEEFSQLSRLPDYQSILLEKSLSSQALGDNTLKFIDMTGRVQVDLLKVIQRDHNLGSYKLDNVAEHFISGKITDCDPNNPSWIQIGNAREIDKGNYVIITQTKDGKKFNHGDKIKILDKTTRIKKKTLENGAIEEKKSDWIKLEVDFDPSVFNKNPKWGLGKDDVNYKEIFRLQKEGGPSGRRIIAIYCIQDCVLCIRIIRKLEIIANNIGMANVSSVPFSYIFLRGQGVKIFSLVAKECREQDFLIPVLNIGFRGDEDEQLKKIRAHIKELDSPEDENEENHEGPQHFRKSNADDQDYQIGAALDNTGIGDYIPDDDDGYEGAIVLDPTPGIYLEEPISVLDYGSLYPSSMISENLCHTSIVLDSKFDNLPGYTYLNVEYDIKKWIDPEKKSLGKTTVGKKTCRYVQFPDGSDGKPVKGIIPMILQKLLAARKLCKKKKDAETDPFKASVWDGLQLAYKVTANSLYGQIGAKTSPIYLKDVAASTTATGRRLLTLARDFVELNFEGAKVIYGDTDSIFIKFKLVDDDGNQLSGIPALKKSIDLGIQADKLIQKYLKTPHVLEYEKTFWPFILLTKKRYVGNLYETDVNEYVQKSMGIVLKRRDNAPIVKYIFGGIIDVIMNQRSLEASVDFLKKALQQMLDGKFDLQMLVISKTLRIYCSQSPSRKNG
jgi:DNA polymerase elongation subunit (family B)